MKKKRMLMAACLLTAASWASAQSRVTGTVVSSEDGQPVVGASVIVPGTKIGVVTDVDGKFSLTVPQGHKNIRISSVGMHSQEVAAKGNLRISLESNSKVLGEVMVVAYGGQTKQSFTGAATQLKGDNLAMKSPTELSNALAGEVAGVQVLSTSGQPGSTASIRIRGLGSAYSSRQPLYVVDGMPYEADLSNIDPGDIASITVLKDATATALYGSRAANGVIIVTTKKGSAGKTKIEASFEYGANMRLIPQYDVIKSPERFTELSWESLKGYGELAGASDPAAWASSQLFGGKNGIPTQYNMWNAQGSELIDPATGLFKSGVTRKYTPEDWSDYIFRTGQRMNTGVKISGGNDKLTHFTSFNYLKDEGYYISSDYQRLSVRNNLSEQITPWLKATTSLAYTYSKTNQPGQSSDQANNGFQFVNSIPALYPVYERDENGNLIPDTNVGGYRYDYSLSRPYASGINPAGALLLDTDATTGHAVNGNGTVEARFLKYFKATANVGLQYVGNNRSEITNPYYGDAAGQGYITKYQTNYLSFTANQILSWKQSFGLNNFDAFIGHESSSSKTSLMYGQKGNMVRPNNTEWSNAVKMNYIESYTYAYAIESYFAQLRYDYDNKYFLNGSIRTDGSSRFARGHRWGTFGSVGAAWAVTREDFMKPTASWLKDLKVKASWGYLGNQDFNTSPVAAGYYPYNDLYTINNLNDQYTFSFKYKGNPDLTWEKTSSFNAGVEFNIADILEGEVDYFSKVTSDMLFSKQVAPSMGYATTPVNDGRLKNNGIEFSLTAHLLNKKDYKFDFRVNGGWYKNEMTKMPIDASTGKEKALENATYYGWAKGHSLYDFYLREYAGVDPKTGNALYNAYYDVADDGTKTLITDMETYKAANGINKLEVKTTDDYNAATKKFVGKSGIPDLQGGFGFNLYAKGFTLDATFSYGIGGYGYDYVYAQLMSNGQVGVDNWHKDIERRWQKEGDITDVPRLSNDVSILSDNPADQTTYANSTSTRFLTSRSYLSLSNIRLGYTFPKEWAQKLYLSNLSVYVSANNLFYASARKGYISISAPGETGELDNDKDGGVSGLSQYAPVSSVLGGIKIEF